MESSYIISGKRVSSAEDLQPYLEIAYESKERPLCTCVTPHVEMYIAKLNHSLKDGELSGEISHKNTSYILKRMPETGGNHSYDCISYEIPIGLSGLGQVSGTAIQENIEDGITTLRLGFSLSKGGTRAAPEPPKGIKPDSVKTDGKKLGFIGTLHHLWEQTELSKWPQVNDERRNWHTIRKHLYEASKSIKVASNVFLNTVLFVPESFNLDYKDDITKRRLASMSQLNTSTKGNQKLMIMIGEVKEFAKARFDFKVIIKHLPDFHIMLNEDIYNRLKKHFDVELDLWSTNENSHLILIGTFGFSASGTPTFNEIALMTVNENWLPYESLNELQLLNKLTRENKKFTKSLRYNLPTATPLASVIMTNANKTTALYICPAAATETYKNDLHALIEDNQINYWLWDAGSEELPSLPV